MKKKFRVILIGMMALCLVACGDDAKKKTNEDGTENNINASNKNQQIVLNGVNDYLLVDSREEEGFQNSTGIFVNNSGNIIELYNAGVCSVRDGVVAYEDDKGKLALRNLVTGNVITDEYSSYKWLISEGSDDLYSGLDKYLIVKKDDKYGVIDTEGNVVIECIYTKDITHSGDSENPIITCRLGGDEEVYYNADFEKITLEDAEETGEAIEVFAADMQIKDRGTLLKEINESTNKYTYKSAKTGEILFEESDNMYNIYKRWCCVL